MRPPAGAGEAGILTENINIWGSKIHFGWDPDGAVKCVSCVNDRTYGGISIGTIPLYAAYLQDPRSEVQYKISPATNKMANFPLGARLGWLVSCG